MCRGGGGGTKAGFDSCAGGPWELRKASTMQADVMGVSGRQDLKRRTKS